MNYGLKNNRRKKDFISFIRLGWIKKIFILINFLMFSVIISSCNEQTSIAGKIESEFSAGTRVGLFLPINHEIMSIKNEANQYYNAAKLAAEDLRPIPLEIILYETDGTVETIKGKTKKAIGDDINIAVGIVSEEEESAFKSFLNKSQKIFLSFSEKDLTLYPNIFHVGVGKVNLANSVIDYAVSQHYNNFLIIEGEQNGNTIKTENLMELIHEKGGTILRQLKPSNAKKLPQEIKDLTEEFQSSLKKQAVIILGTPDQNIIFSLASMRSLLEEKRGSEIQIIGLAKWAINSHFLSEPALENAWFPYVNHQRAKEFSRRYRELYGSNPSGKSAVAYDSIAVIGALLQEAEKTKALNPFTYSSITDKSGFLGVTGTFRFLQDGSSDRLLGIAENQKNKVHILEKPLDRF